MKAWRMNELGDPWDKMAAEECELPEATGELCRVKVEATDLNFADILQCQGAYQVKREPPFTPGMNATGTVLEAGPDARVKPGDMVIGGAASGGYAQECVMRGPGVTVIPKGVDPTAAAAMHVTYGTAWFSLRLRGNLQPGETVLVLAAAGGVGSAAVELAKVYGCYVIAAAGGDEKTAMCRKLGADEVIDYNAEDMYERVMALTDKRGVDVVYDPVGGDYFNVARRLVAWEGRLLIVGFASGTIPSVAVNHVLVKNYSVVGVHMGGYHGRNEEPFKRCYDELYGMLQQKKISPWVDEVVGFDALPDALKRLAERKTKGRVIFDPHA